MDKLWINAKRALGAVLGCATGAGVASALHLVGVDITPELAGALAGVLLVIGGMLAPKARRRVKG
jgi:hypothetical protein